METRTQGVPGYYVWEAAGNPVVVHLRLDVVDRLAAEVMRGFGVVPKRGAEVGGLLIGTIQAGFPATVRVEDFEPIACDYARGPSYLFAESDAEVFEDSCQRWHPSASPSLYAVGFFRSHTRDGFGLADDDVQLLDQFFANPAHIALLIKPFATKVSLAGFFVREHGQFPAATPLEFPLRRRELTGEAPAPRRPAAQRRSAARNLTLPLEESWNPPAPPEPEVVPEPVINAPVAEPADRPRARLGWLWIPLSFILLLLGGVIGFQVALTMGGRPSANPPDDLSLALSVIKNDDNLMVKWDSKSPVIRTAQKGTLEIEEGGYTKPVELDPSQLLNGSLIYRNSSDEVHFRLTIYPSARVSVTETLNWKR